MQAFSPGYYVTTAEANLSEHFELSSNTLRMFEPGTEVNVVEVKESKEDEKIRGRIDMPEEGWVSLMNTRDGFKWADTRAEAPPYLYIKHITTATHW